MPIVRVTLIATQQPQPVLPLMRTASILVLLLIAALAGIYAALPLLVVQLGPAWLAPRGIVLHEIVIDHPGWSHWHVDTLVMRSNATSVTLEDADLTYDFWALLDGQLEHIRVSSVRIEHTTSDTPQEPQNTAPDALIGGLFDLVPAETVNIVAFQLYLPAQDLRARGSAQINATEMAIEAAGITPEAAGRYAADIAIARNGTVSVRAKEQGGHDHLDLRATPTADTIEFNGDFYVAGYAFSLAMELAGFPQSTGAIASELSGQLPWPLALDSIWTDLKLDTRNGSLTWHSEQPKLNLNLPAITTHIADGAVDTTVRGELSGSVEAGTFTLTLPEDFNIAFANARLVFEAGARFDYAQSTLQADGTVDQLQIELAEPMTADFVVTSQVSHPPLRLDGTATGYITWESLSGKTTISGLATYDQHPYPLTIATTHQLEQDKLLLNGTFSAAAINNAAFTASYTPSSGAGDLQSTHALLVTKPLAKAMVPGWTAPYDIISGTLDTTAHLRWQSLDEINADITTNLKQVRVKYDDYHIDGTTGTLALSIPHLAALDWSLKPTRLHAAGIDVGFPVTDLQAELSGSHKAVHIQAASGRLLGGHAEVSPFTYDMIDASAQFDVQLNDLDLAQVLALEGEKVAGTGTLTGTLPVTIQGEAVSIEAGNITAHDPGGTIKLSPDLATATGQPGLDFALTALQNFNFSTLNGTVNYQPSGDLAIGVSLLGRNPAVEKGRAIQYNLNITENLPVLLESLRIQDDVTKRLERKMNKSGE